MFSEKELNLEEHELRERIRRLPAPEKQHYHELELSQLKDPTRYLRLNWLFPLGVHHFYLERWDRGAVNLGMTGLSLFLITGADQRLFGVMMLAAMVFIEIPQFLNAGNLVHNRNNRIMANCLARVERKMEHTS